MSSTIGENIKISVFGESQINAVKQNYSCKNDEIDAKIVNQYMADGIEAAKKAIR